MVAAMEAQWSRLMREEAAARQSAFDAVRQVLKDRRNELKRANFIGDLLRAIDDEHIPSDTLLELKEFFGDIKDIDKLLKNYHDAIAVTDAVAVLAGNPSAGEAHAAFVTLAKLGVGRVPLPPGVSNMMAYYADAYGEAAKAIERIQHSSSEGQRALDTWSGGNLPHARNMIGGHLWAEDVLTREGMHGPRGHIPVLDL